MILGWINECFMTFFPFKLRIYSVRIKDAREFRCRDTWKINSKWSLTKHSQIYNQWHFLAFFKFRCLYLKRMCCVSKITVSQSCIRGQFGYQEAPLFCLCWMHYITCILCPLIGCFLMFIHYRMRMYSQTMRKLMKGMVKETWLKIQMMPIQKKMMMVVMLGCCKTLLECLVKHLKVMWLVVTECRIMYVIWTKEI